MAKAVIYITPAKEKYRFTCRRKESIRKKHNASIVIEVEIEPDGKVRIVCSKNRKGHEGVLVLNPIPVNQ